MVVAACGSGSTPHTATDGAVLADVSIADGATDVAVDVSWPVGLIKVTVLDYADTPSGSEPKPGRTIVFTDVNQTQTVVTDSNGEASATVTGPTTVTHLNLGTSLSEGVAVLSAMPGDDILLKRKYRNYTESAPLSVSFTHTGATHYVACGPCRCGTGDKSPISVPMFVYCQASSVNVTLLVYQGTEAVGFSTTTTTYNPTTGGQVTISGALATPLQFTGTFANVPSDATSIVFDFESVWSSRATAQMPPSNVNLQVQGWTGAPAHFRSWVFSNSSSNLFFEDIEPTTTGYSLDVATAQLKWLGDPVFDPTTATLSVPSSASGSTGDLYAATFAYTRAVGGAVLWTVFAETPAAFKVPYIPPSVADMTPAPGSSGSKAAFIYDAKSVTGYAQARLEPYAVAHAIANPPVGRFVYSASPYASISP